MARYSTSGVSQTAQLQGVNSGTTVNGYLGYWGASATAGYRLRRVTWGIQTTTASPVTVQQWTLGVYRQSVAPAGTGLAAAVLGQAQEFWTPQTDPTVGLIMTTAATIGTTAPTLAANPIRRVPLNTQNTFEMVHEGMDELICNLGTANGFAFVILGGNTLPTATQVVIDIEIEV